ncbi:MAG: twin-arginine translocase TatA/TatE family subunit [Candidatus Calescibacterium sp.]|nr:twin-arginine translocase TatA/TatE family subunit [Candidatus Calescibacterium sp.]MCX7734636.1 twin-arginine translocase TatA/TatE family subunit [bacterium]MDW8087014.1 twin-arginine translocase TatA/TatE family subunit [Candidatus Calescibacterium sp.]
MIGGIGIQELIIILLIVSLLFGARKIPELARGIGQALKEFRKTMKEDDSQKTSKEKENTEEKIETKKDQQIEEAKKSQEVRKSEITGS